LFIGHSQTIIAYDGHISCMIDTTYKNIAHEFPYNIHTG
jgi:hypothetical protein